MNRDYELVRDLIKSAYSPEWRVDYIPFPNTTEKPKTAEALTEEAKKLAAKEAEEAKAKAAREKRSALDKARYEKSNAAGKAAQEVARKHDVIGKAVSEAKDARRFVARTEGYDAVYLDFDGHYANVSVEGTLADRDAVRELNGEAPRSEVQKEVDAAKDAFAQVIRASALEYAASLEAIAAKHLASK